MDARRTYPCFRLSIFMPLAWLALLVGAPQVLAPPGPFACDGLSLAFSALTPAMALAGLAGCMAPRIRREHERVLAVAGALAMLAYLSGCWWGAAGFSWESVNSTPHVSSALAMSCVACLCAALASFACGYMVSGDVADFPAGEHGERVWTVGCALLAAALLGLSARFMPNWTLARVSAAAAGTDDELLLGAFTLGGLGDMPGMRPLSSGVPSCGLAMLLPSVAWSVVTLGLGAIAMRLRVCSARSIIRGYCAGLFLAWLLSSLFPALGRALVWDMAVPLVLLVLALTVMAIGVASSARKAEECDEEIADTGRIGTAFEGSGLSPRESEALRLRLAGLSSAKVAVQMEISASTVRNLQSRALDKLRVASIDELRAGALADEPRHAGDEASRSWRIMLLAALWVAVVVGWALGQDWATDYVAVMLLGLCLVFYGFVSPGDDVSRTALRVAPAICFVGSLLGFIPLLALVLTLTMAVVRFAGYEVRRLHTPVMVFPCLGLGMLLGGYSAGLVPRLPALLALISNDEAAMACAMLAGLVSGAYVIAGAVSLFLSVRDELEWVSSSAGMSADGGRGRRLSAYLVSRGLNETEVDVVMLLVAGCGGAEICSKRCLSPGAVNSARRTAYRKLGIHSLVELVDLCQDAVK